MGWILAAAAIAAASSIAVNEMNAGRGKKTPGASVGGEKKSFEMPDLFKNKGGSLMGGGAAPGGETPLSQKIAEPAINPPNPPRFGPAGGGAFAGGLGQIPDELKRQRMLNSLMGGR